MGEIVLAKKNKKEEKSLIDEVVDLKFGKGSIADPKKRREITEFLEDLYLELDMLNYDDDDEEEESEHRPPNFDHEMVSSINSDEARDGMIPFVVVKKEKTVIDIKCPHCGEEDKIFLSKFRGSQYDEYDCPKCKKKSLAKLNFIPDLKIYIEKVNECASSD